MNFDGASKGNLGPTGFGFVLRDEKGTILHISVGSLGYDLNNAADLWALIKGLTLSHHHGYHQIVVEGDSQIILNMLTKLLHGSSLENISPSWRLLHLLDYLRNLLQPHQVLIPSHIKREANKVANKLVNIGVHWPNKDLFCDSSQHSDHPIFLECNTLACLADLPPDGVISIP
jgi:ribonuclease HI